MRRRLSASSTPFIKFILPALWLVASIGVALVVPRAASYLALWRVTVLIPPLLMVWSFAPLKYVAMDEDFLYVSNYWREIQIPFSQIAEVRERQGSRNTMRDITIQLTSPTEFGDQIHFVPRLILWPSAAALQEATSLAETNRGAAATALSSSFSVAEAIRQRAQRAVSASAARDSVAFD
ncbi:MAG: hypothetical protein CYG59_02695 [Chloroflexi bacterium]|nr:MAG: hypothetical protein CYG59_02695 [Chloroflexota bacterium]